MRKLWILTAVSVALAAIASAAMADDWLADKLRGPVLQLVDKEWQPLERGMVVSDNRMIRTLAAGHVTFTRGGETVELGPSTLIQIFDKGGARPFTTIKEATGTVSIEAQVQNVQHFAVETPYLAAVVKGTRFTVTSSKTGSAVGVRRGHVEVADKGNNTHVLLAVGQSAVVDVVKTGGAIVVSGDGKLPTVVNSKGEPVAASSSATSSSSGAESSSSSSGVGVSVGVGSSSVSASANVGSISAGASAGGGGVSVAASVGGTSAGVSAGGGGINVHLGGIHLGL
jgi:hypothetical protein